MNSVTSRRAGPWVAAAVASILAGCASTHDLAPQSGSVQIDSLQTRQSLEAVPTEASRPDARWWLQFNDPQLNQLIDEALTGSPTLQVAEARTRAALAQSQVSNAARLPQVGLSADTTRERFPDHSIYPPPYAGHWDTMSNLQSSVNWEIDFWGKNRAAFQQAVGAARAAQLDADAARLALSVSVAHAYVQLQRAFLQLDVANATLTQREQIYELTQDRAEAGVDSRLELRQAQSAIPAAREQIAQIEEVIELSRTQLAALLGQGPDRGRSIARPRLQSGCPYALPGSVPSELLGRRPDILAQRWRVEAASHAIDNAKAQFYPNVNLAAFAGFQALGPASLVTAGSREIGAGPALTLPLFDGGRRRGMLAARDADYDAAVGQYNQAIADGLRDVVDQVVSGRSVAEQRAQQVLGLSAAQDAYDLATLRYREGVGSYLQVLTTETPLLAQRSLDADLKARAADISIELARSLGGGFDSPALVRDLSVEHGP